MTRQRSSFSTASPPAYYRMLAAQRDAAISTAQAQRARSDVPG